MFKVHEISREKFDNCRRKQYSNRIRIERVDELQLCGLRDQHDQECFYFIMPI